ncbi:MAG: enoyl-CoA hydratase/isomerase family protein [Hyphomonadaceae bacterium JAD_PAG50586_4]|nr:MAG: enoyl-CoA hydratase/isomerase family protein [Hyphomonadaceae bacterium JAD_PAG50586_4]
MGLQLRRSLAAALCDVATAPVQAILLSGDNGRFVSGADITELDQPVAAPDLLDIEQLISNVRAPVIANLQGQVLGGGFLLALMCDARVANPATYFGYPEVQLGLVPTFGGTQITPRLCGPEFAAELMASGAPIDAPRALAHGLIDAIEDDAERWVQVRSAHLAKRRALHLPWRDDDARDRIAVYRAALALARPGFDAPLAALDAMRVGYDAPLSEALKVEHIIFESLRQSAQSKTLRELFFAERAAARAAVRDDTPVAVLTPGLLPKSGWVELVCGAGDRSLRDAVAAARAQGVRCILSSRTSVAGAMLGAMRAAIDQPASLLGPARLAVILRAGGFRAKRPHIGPASRRMKSSLTPTILEPSPMR